MQTPAISVLMAVWNPNRAYAEQAIRSILDQTFRDFELIVVEDPSPVTLADVIAGANDPRIRFVRRGTRGMLGSALNAGLREARAELVARIDADDIAMPERLARQYQYMNAHLEIAVYGSRITVIDESGRPIARRLLPLTHDGIATALRRYNCISHPSVIFRKSVVLKAGGYDEHRAAEDYDLWCRLMLSGARFANADEDLVRYRFHAEAAKWRDVSDSIRVTMDIKKRYFKDRFTPADRMRLAGERLLLRLPPRWVITLFRMLEYRKPS